MSEIKTEFIKLNDEPILIEYVEDEHDSELDYKSSFWFRNHRYYLKDFVRCHNNPWISDTGIPENITGMEDDNYYNPLFIEVISAEEINVYEEKEV